MLKVIALSRLPWKVVKEPPNSIYSSTRCSVAFLLQYLILQSSSYIEENSLRCMCVYRLIPTYSSWMRITEGINCKLFHSLFSWISVRVSKRSQRIRTPCRHWKIVLSRLLPFFHHFCPSKIFWKSETCFRGRVNHWCSIGWEMRRKSSISRWRGWKMVQLESEFCWLLFFVNL